MAAATGSKVIWPVLCEYGLRASSNQQHAAAASRSLYALFVLLHLWCAKQLTLGLTSEAISTYTGHTAAANELCCKHSVLYFHYPGSTLVLRPSSTQQQWPAAVALTLGPASKAATHMLHLIIN